MILTYWHGDADHIGSFMAEWSSSVEEPAVYGDDVVDPILADLDPEWAVVYRQIRLPACRSDIARLALLHRFGGLYIDAHTGQVNVPLLAKLVGRLSTYDLLLAEAAHKASVHIPRVIQNGAMLARRGSDTLVTVLASLMDNLMAQRKKEAHGAAPGGYNLAALSGAWPVRMCFFKKNQPELVAAPQFEGRVATFSMDHDIPTPFVFYRHYSYRSPGAHWSERQKIEPLFLAG